MNAATYARRNLLRRPGRTVLTILVVALTVLIFCAIRTLIHSFTGGVEDAAADRIGTRHKVSYTMELPRHYIDDLRQVPGVEKATWATWFGAKDPKQRVPFFAGIAVDQDSYFDVQTDMHVAPDQLAAWKQTRNGAILGDLLAKKFGVKVGDRLVIDSDIYPGEWDLTVSGTYTATRANIDRGSLIFRWDYLNSDPRAIYSKDQIGWMLSRISDPLRSAEISRQIDAKFASFDDQTATMSEQALALGFLGGFVAVLSAFNIGSLVILLIMALVLANTIAMNARERTHEYGVLRAIGFTPRYLIGFIVGESVLIALIGGLVGVLLTVGIINHTIGPFTTQNLTPVRNFFTPGATIAVALIAAIVLGLVAGIVPGVRASRLKTTDALRRVD
ncbi:MAG TPA: FtsX-like permease family protein [Ilumatobacteraceae bacterium]|jgi:putative ABC transport system permease protein